MKVKLLFLILPLCMVGCKADVNVSDYVYWKKDNISKWHEYFPSRYLEQERLTNDAAAKAADTLQSGLTESLKKLVVFQYHELETAKQLMAGTDAEGCLNGISNYLDQAVSDEFEEYQDRTADVYSKLSRLKNNLSRANTTYQASYQRALAGIDTCAKTYPNKDSIERLRSCIESMITNYFVTANNTQNSMLPSPSMTYFQNTVVVSASDSAKNIVAKGYQFLKMLANCAALSGTVDPTAYEEELSQWTGYNDTLSLQILRAQVDNFFQIWNVEKEMLNYYNLQKQALEQYVIESRGLDFYLKKIYGYLSDYYNTVTATSLDNPGDSECVAAAKSALDEVASSGATKSLTCDQVIVNDTQRLWADQFDNFSYLNNRMSTIGNVALLNCFSEGYVFAPYTISKCFRMTYSEFQIEFLDRRERVGQNTETITNYIIILNFMLGHELPCGDSSLKSLYLGADKALYQLQRCLYQSSGSTYEVTTPTSR